MADITYGFDSDRVRRIVKAVKAYERDAVDTTGSDKFRLTPNVQGFWGKTASDSYTNNRYTVTRENVSNTDTDATSLVTFADSSGDFAQSVTVTNVAEAVTHSHILPVGSVVWVWWEYDPGDSHTVRYLMDETPIGMFPVKCTKDGGSAGSMNSGTTCSFTYSLKDVFGHSIDSATGLTPAVTRYANCKYDTPADDSPGIAFYDGSGNIKLYSVAQEKPTGSVVTNITDIQVVDASHIIQVKTQDQLVLDNKDKSGWTTIYTGSTCS
jgi:hypothetical protein